MTADGYLLILAVVLNTALAEAAGLAAAPGDRAALDDAAAAVRNLACCYDEGLGPGLAEAAVYVCRRPA